MAELTNPNGPDIRVSLGNEFMGRSTSQYFNNTYKSHPIGSRISLEIQKDTSEASR